MRTDEKKDQEIIRKFYNKRVNKRVLSSEDLQGSKLMFFFHRERHFNCCPAIIDVIDHHTVAGLHDRISSIRPPPSISYVEITIYDMDEWTVRVWGDLFCSINVNKLFIRADKWYSTFQDWNDFLIFLCATLHFILMSVKRKVLTFEWWVSVILEIHIEYVECILLPLWMNLFVGS